MKTKVKYLNATALAVALILGGAGIVQADEEDTNATTVAYWKLGALATVPENSLFGSGILDLATNVGQGTLANTSIVPASVQNLWFQGPLASNPTFSSSVPPTSMFNANNYFTTGSGSWDCGADQYPSARGSLVCDNTTYGNSFNGPDFTWEMYFKSDTTNDPVTGLANQCLIFDHHQSAYAFLFLNSNTDNTNNIGSLVFWGWNVAVFGIDCRITAAQNHGHRMDDGHWHYVACRFTTATETMDMLVVNDDGTSTETSTYITEALNPGGSGSQGPVFIGTDEGENVPFDGLINQVRYSNVSLPNSQLLANASTCNAPVFENVPSTNLVSAGSFLNLTAAPWPVQVFGGPLQYQWQLGGVNIPGQTNLSLNLYPASVADSGTYQLVATTPCGGISVTSPPITAQIVPAIPLARWGFNFTEANTFPQATVDDLAPNYLNVYDLITFNNEPNVSGIGGNGEIPLTNSVPPTTMFINGNNGGTNAFDAGYLALPTSAPFNQDGVVFYPNGSGPGDPFDFQTSFSLELFFRTYGDQSANGTMELICQGTDGGNTFRYGVNVNQAAPGALTFNINNYSSPATGNSYEDFNNPAVQSVVLSNANYADGNWHYVLAQYDSVANTISLHVANMDNSGTNATVVLPVGYGPLPNYSEGNLFVGRYRYPFGDDNRDFIGAIDEVQVSAGLTTPSAGQLGYLPAPPRITGISANSGTVTIQFSGAPAALASSYSVVASATVTGTYSAVSATVTSLGGGNFQATLATSGSAEFYKIKH